MKRIAVYLLLSGMVEVCCAADFTFPVASPPADKYSSRLGEEIDSTVRFSNKIELKVDSGEVLAQTKELLIVARREIRFTLTAKPMDGWKANPEDEQSFTINFREQYSGQYDGTKFGPVSFNPDGDETPEDPDDQKPPSKWEWILPYVGVADLQVDSLNNKPYGGVTGSDQEDSAEDTATGGKIIFANSAAYTANSGKPGWADFGAAPQTHLSFAAMHLFLQGFPGTTKVRFKYSGSDPAGVTQDPTTGEWKLPEAGCVRVWSKNVYVARSAADYIAPNAAFTFADLKNKGAQVADGHFVFYIEAVKAAQTAADSKVIAEVNTGSGWVAIESVRLVSCELAVDSNRDGVVKFAGNYNSTDPDLSGKPQDKTEETKPFTFWINDDHDGSGTGSEELEGAADSADNEIKSKRDLEDFARLNIYLGGLQDAVLQGNINVGLKWKGTTDSPSIKVWQNRSPGGGDEYLKDDSIAGQHLSLTNPGLVQGTSTYIIPTTFWQQQGFSETQPCGYMLFEGVSEGKGHLVITIHKSDGTEIGEGPGVWLDLKTIKDMYERATALPLGLIAPFDRTTNFNIATASVTTSGASFEKPWDETKECIVFVHGWNTDEAAYDWTSATLFKRLWHRGFKGRFGAFRWDTLMGPGFESFHISEWRGYKFGKSLQDYVTNLKSRLSGYSMNVMSHSLGAAVLASALDRGAGIDNCIFMQGSLSAHAFDSLAQNRSGTFNAPDLAADGGYRGWLTPSLTNVVNFFNSDDLALFTWQAYQNGKPHNPTGPGQYTYSLASGCRIEYSSGSLPSRSTFDQHESMAFVAVSRSAAVGAEFSALHVIDRGVNINAAPFNYGTEHGPQFDRNIQNNTLPFFREILDSFSIPFNP